MRDRIATDAAAAISRGAPLDAFAELGRLYHSNGYLETAMVCYTGLASIQPDEARWPHLHASILAGFGQAASALNLWQQVIALDPTYVPARLRLVDLLLKTNQRDAAITAYRDALAQDRDNAWALLGLARIEFEDENYRDARPRLERIVALTNYTLGYDLIVTLYERLGLDDRAAAIRGRAEASGAYRDPPDPWLDELMADCYDPFRLALEACTKARSGDSTTAVVWLERAIAVAPQDLSAHFQLANLMAQQRNVPWAMELYLRCTQLDPQFADGWAQLSGLHAQLGNNIEADRILEEGLTACPDSPGLHLMKVRKFRAAKNVGAAIGEFRTSIRLRPNEARAYLELGMLLLEQNRMAEGIAVLQQALVFDPAHPSMLGIMALHSIDTGDRAAADEWLGKGMMQPRIDADQVTRIQSAYERKFGPR
ncbi:MAG: tetratricopeptide repeat protein [Candidatus Synoicihabitans palmerolidicus]|nr:tetratricopeptide repeat protein [Candidatus Synoicihabitans palmerolidicus]